MENTLKIFGFEIYTLHPETKESGWGLLFVEVIAESKAEAKEILKAWDLFDEIILFNYEVKQDCAPYYKIYKKGVIIEVDHRYIYKKIIK